MMKSIINIFLLFGLSLLTQSCFNKKYLDYSLIDWPKVNTEKILGQATGIDVNSKNQIIVFHRADRGWVEPMPEDNIQLPTIFVYDAYNGVLIKSFGVDEFIMPHGLSVDKNDNIWVTDVGAHQVKKFSENGELLLTLGNYRISGNDEKHFGMPTDIAFDSQGDIYISDGYLNSRIIKYTNEGIFLNQWGSKGDSPGEFDLPHGITIDKYDNIYVADRSNSRIQIFNSNGDFINEISGKEFGRPYGLSILESKLVVIDGGNQPYDTKSRVVIIDLINNSYIGEFDASLASDTKNLGHDIAVVDNMIFTADVWLNKIRKFVYNK